MFMFRSKRNTLVKRLWKARIRGEHEAQRSSEGGGSGGGGGGVGGWCGGGGGGGGGGVAGWCGGTADVSSSGMLCRGGAGGGGDGGGSPMAVAATAEEEAAAAPGSPAPPPAVEGASAHQLHQLRTVLVKRLKEQQLERLLAAVESRGADDFSGCVLVPREGCEGGGESGKEEPMEESAAEDEEAAAAVDSAGSSPTSSPNCCAYLSSHHHQSTFHHLQHQHRHNNPPPVPPQVLCCQIWRWPDLRLPSELKRLPLCKTAKDPVYICCNPYHWSRLCKPESPPPPYCRFAKERLKPEDRAPSEREATAQYGSLTTNGEGEGGEREWCKLAYWELGTRVGRQYSVELPAVNVFSARHRGDGLCLATLAAHHRPVPSAEPVRRTRSKIGLGVTLSQEPDGVWVYNRSESPIFVNSPTLDDPDLRTLLVYRVPSGHCLKIFDGERKRSGVYNRATWDPRDGPIDPNSVRISFAKGWGSKYTRQEITSCPCWLEVLLVPCR